VFIKALWRVACERPVPAEAFKASAFPLLLYREYSPRGALLRAASACLITDSGCVRFDAEIQSLSFLFPDSSRRYVGADVSVSTRALRTVGWITHFFSSWLSPVANYSGVSFPAQWQLIAHGILTLMLVDRLLDALFHGHAGDSRWSPLDSV